MNFNRVLLGGRLTCDPELHTLPSNLAVVNIGVAINSKRKTATGEYKETVVYVDCSAFGKTAEAIKQYFTKGKPIFIEGKLRMEKWQGKTDNKWHTKLSITIDNFQFVDFGKPADPQDGGEVSIPASDKDEADIPF